MPQPAVDTESPEMTPIRKIRVQIRADSFLYEGYLHLVAETRRIQELLNDPKPFLNLTEVVIHDRNSATTDHAPYVALNKGAISHVLVLSGDRTGLGAKEEDTREHSGPSSRAMVAASQPTIPPAGPRTLPAPPPPGAQSGSRRGKGHGEPTTQPYPKKSVPRAARSGSGEDVSDLMLDESDDIDPDDLERDVGALVTGSPRED
jgi:hypothetical protein